MGDAKTDGRVSVFAISGTQSTPEARTAARSSSQEIAANARIDDKLKFSGTDFSLVLSQANYNPQLAPDNAFVRHASIDFVLPPSYLEITSSIELPNASLDTVFLGDLRVCFAVACGPTDSVFHIQADLEASASSQAHSATVTGNPQLDLTPLLNPVLTFTDAGFLHTWNLAFPLYQGHLDMGTVPPGTPLTVEYLLQARASGVLRANIAISSVND